MRIISGQYKGRRLISPKGGAVRPTSDKVKETMFNILSSRGAVQDSVVLDLFCGSGALGIEALSRGAQWVDFVDSDRESMSCTMQNIGQLSVNNYACINQDWQEAILMLGQHNKKYDLILMDPPYNTNVHSQVIVYIMSKRILDKDGYMICETARSATVCVDSTLIDVREYILGNTKLHLMQP